MRRGAVEPLRRNRRLREEVMNEDSQTAHCVRVQKPGGAGRARS
jgi:hypothetical protein